LVEDRQPPREHIVLGGDVFDFRWSTFRSHSQTLGAALDWLERLLEQTPYSQLTFLPGNHDCHPDFLDRLSLLAERDPRFAWYPHHVQLGNCLFLHGDILDALPRGQRAQHELLAQYRSRFHHTQPQPQLAQRTYDLAVEMRIHKIVPLVRHQRFATCSRLWGYIQDLDLASEHPIEKVFFGHTHVPIHGLEVDQVRFFNPGAALRHMQACIHEFTL
jgi:UDP-2,3-diacylglucosamine hydrolase